MKNRLSGFTLIELLVVLAIVGILTALAIPSFNTMLMKRTVRSAALALINDMRYARSEALRRSVRVSVCSLAAGSTNTCSGSPAVWTNGWIVFSDIANSGVVNIAAGDEIVRVQQSLANIASIASVNPISDRNVISFEANGRGRVGVSTQTFIFTPTGTVPADTVRIVCVSNQGRLRLLDEGVIPGASVCP
jgi:type IV fimbrial biogenesis protein FimT